MKGIAICIGLLTMTSAATLAESGSDALSRCTLPSYEERMRCLEKLAGSAPAPTREVAPSPAPAPKAAPPSAGAGAPPANKPPPGPTPGKWIVSETRSPADYSPVVTATGTGIGSDGSLQISIQCRSGTTEMTIRGGGPVRRLEDDVVSYSVNNAPWVVVLSGLSPSGNAIELKGDVPGFLATLPPKGRVVFRLANKQGATLEGAYDLSGLRELVARITGPCKWPRR